MELAKRDKRRVALQWPVNRMRMRREGKGRGREVRIELGYFNIVAPLWQRMRWAWLWGKGSGDWGLGSRCCRSQIQLKSKRNETKWNETRNWQTNNKLRNKAMKTSENNEVDKVGKREATRKEREAEVGHSEKGRVGG